MDRKNIFLSLCAVIFTFGEVWSLEKPKGIEDEIDRMLRKKPTRGIGETVTRALAQEDGSITYDPETEGFKINPGKKVRVAGSSSSNDSKKEPVKQSKPDSIPVRQAHNHEEL
ncbi:hypothetical protein MAR_028591 [Mya arenaria]|uniref:Uncharacterized protein n=1 Tax=Mya arenaria TaxID=6604 RepID=A0ABY7DH09_MYAAR|nr:hypothetical protein MAR_028591 [Mya arenaria]